MASKVILFQFEEHIRIKLIGIFNSLNVSRMSARYPLSQRDSKVSEYVHSFCTRSSVSISFFNHELQAELFVSRIGQIRDVYIGIITYAERFVNHLRTMPILLLAFFHY